MKMGMAVKIICGIGGVVAASIGAAILHAKSKKVAETICKVANVEDAEKQEKVEKAVEKVAATTEKISTGLMYLFPFVASILFIKTRSHEDAEKVKEYEQKDYFKSDLNVNDDHKVEAIWEEVLPSAFLRQVIRKYEGSNVLEFDLPDNRWNIDGDEYKECLRKWKECVPESYWKKNLEVGS